MAKLFKSRGFNAANILTLIVTAAVLLFFIGKVIIPFLSPLFGGGTIPDFAVLENIDVKFWFGIAITTVVLLFIINVFMKEKLTMKTMGIALLLGLAMYYMATNFDIFSWLKASMAAAQHMILP